MTGTVIQVQSSCFPQNAIKAQFSTRPNAICVKKSNNSNDFMFAKTSLQSEDTKTDEVQEIICRSSDGIGLKET